MLSQPRRENRSNDAGLSVGPDGASHQQIEDIYYEIFTKYEGLGTADAISVRKLLEKIVNIPGPFYVRLARPSTEEIYSEESNLEIGKGTILRDGNDISLFSCGTMVSASLKASDILKKDHNISCRVVDMLLH